MVTFIHLFALLGLIVGSYTDLRTREVPDWISHGLIYLGFAVNIVLTIVYKEWFYLLYSVLGFILAFVLGWGMYKLGQWGGGDTKILMGIGSLIGLSPNLFLITFLVNTLLAGAVYGIVWSVVVAFQHRKEFMVRLKAFVIQKHIVRWRFVMLGFLVLGLAVVFSLPAYVRLPLLGLLAAIFLMFYLWIFIKVVEESCMIQNVPVKKITEGDWIVEDVMVRGKRITGPKDLGITKQQLAQLIKLNVKTVKVKYGMPFVPSFLIAFILTLLIGNWYLVFL